MLDIILILAKIACIFFNKEIQKRNKTYMLGFVYKMNV